MGDSATHLYVTRAEKETIQPCQDCGESVDGKRQCNKCFGHLCPETCGVWARTRSVCTACYSDVGTPHPLSIVDCVPSHVGPLHLLFDSQRTKMWRPLVASPHFHKALPLFMVPLLPTLITLPTPPSIPFCSNLPPPPLFQILYPTPQVKNLPPLTPSRTLRGSTPLIRRRRP